ncbi:Mss4/translationally controlled tumor-associated TCTP domain-containing protein [Dioscorea alata]|uniref:Mss4/translationally controlled tumor-associated TCTP domain-containing protein n=1 Tax=Dioscorea alata TaxID=55571 RepID=A0ACB7V8P3_DIOAL|nr:Mss4/translationally controlled tumor-associated TCTP domain-containing protein [Dioscorea alata]
MKNKASSFLKEMFSAIVAVVKAKSLAVKSKTSAMKNRLIIFGLLRNKKVLMSAISHKIHALIAQEKDGENGTASAEEYNKALVLYNTAKNEAPPNNTSTEALELMGDEDEEEEEDGDSYPDLRHSLFDLEDEEDDDGLDNGTGSVIDIVRNSKEDASNFRLEDEIDNVADLFIKRFHKQMRMQKLESFKSKTSTFKEEAKMKILMDAWLKLTLKLMQNPNHRFTLFHRER